MPIISKNNRREYQAPPEGLYQAVCVDVVDLGLQQTAFGDKQQVRLYWMIGEVDENTGDMMIKLNDDGYPFQIVATYTNSMNEKAKLRQHIECWRGKPFGADDERRLADEGFDLEKLIGQNCQLQIAHNIADNGRVYSNIQAVVALDKRLPKLAAPSDYKRKAERNVAAENGVEDPDADITF